VNRKIYDKTMQEDFPQTGSAVVWLVLFLSIMGVATATFLGYSNIILKAITNGNPVPIVGQ